MINDKTVMGVVGPAFSGETSAVQPLFAAAGLTHITQSATRDDLTGHGYQTFFRGVASNAGEASAVTKVLAKIGCKTIAVIDPDRCFGAFACSICQAACPVANCIVEEPDRDGRMVCAVRADLCIGCGLCVTLGNPTAPQQREFGCPPDYDAINMMPFEEVVKVLTTTA